MRMVGARRSRRVRWLVGRVAMALAVIPGALVVLATLVVERFRSRSSVSL